MTSGFIADREAALTADKVTKIFGGRGTRPAVDEVSISVAPGDFTAVVGESGSGKSTLARMLLRLLIPESGEVAYGGRSLASLNRRQMLEFRAAVQCVLQDPGASLNPRKTVREAITEVVLLHKLAGNRRSSVNLASESLESVELDPAVYLDRFPHQLSGGQRQRVLIARAIVLNPRIIIADEAVSALDASVKAGVLGLMERLRRERGIGYLFITHDLPVVKKIAKQVYVMRNGVVVEHGPKSEIFERPKTDYAAELLAAAPLPDPKQASAWLHTVPADITG